MKILSNDVTEVWGDTVNLREMFISILIGAVISVGIFLLAKNVLGQLNIDKKLLDGYAMLIGIGGCLLSGIVCSVMFEPKRMIITETQNSQQKIQEILQQYIIADSHYESVKELPLDTINELEQLGLKHLIINIENTSLTDTSNKSS